MSHKLINRSPDLKKLRDEGYELETRGAHGLVDHVPYVTASKEIKYGTLVSSLNLSSEKTTTPENHVIYFIGEHPCNRDGSRIQSIVHGSGDVVLDVNLGIRANHSFSNRPATGFPDYYEKFTSYIRIIASQAEAIDKNVTAKTYKPIESKDTESVFNYLDTNSSRASINAISSKLEGLKVAIIGLGGTGSYVLDYVSKSPVLEIRTFDGDLFLQHNAFRAPGAVSLQQLEAHAKKVNHYHGIYSQMRKGIFAHDYHLGASNVTELAGMSFVFLCIDDGESKKAIVSYLISAAIPFVDV